KKIFFSSFGGRNYSGNPRRISEELYKLNPKLKYIWCINKDVSVKNLPPYIKRVDNNSLLATFHLYTSKVWIDDSRKTIFFKKRKNQIYFQTWHGTPLKKIEFDAVDKLPNSYLNYALKDSESLDYLLSGNKYSSDIYASAFRIDENKIANVGTPRNDQLCLKIDKEVSLFEKETIKLLFAPTFRNNKADNGQKQLDILGIPYLVKYFESLNKKVEIYLKFHPNVNQSLIKQVEIRDLIKKYSVHLIDNNVSSEDTFLDMDLLITDYSSIFFDFALLNKPIILLNYDEDEYKKERGFYIDLDYLPLPKAKSYQEILAIFEHDRETLIEGPKMLLKKIGNFETGKATNFVTEKILENIER
ncbi:teichoic acid biosynthesis protein F, partial [Enterococcus faecalis]|nr:teichoic acid biosynthesis protein F [Enterococcus faecalis]